jgi:hypothetical protein
MPRSPEVVIMREVRQEREEMYSILAVVSPLTKSRDRWRREREDRHEKGNRDAFRYQVRDREVRLESFEIEATVCSVMELKEYMESERS